jgi:phosphoribosyl-ATP pyrophosphohydrolase
MVDTLNRLAATIAARRGADAGSSYTASLFARGLPKIAQKLGEEAVETVIAALSGDPKAVTGEAADLLFHLLVLLDASDVPLADVLAELDRREGVSGLDEKAARQPSPKPISIPAPIDAAPSLAMGDAAADDDRPRIRKG